MAFAEELRLYLNTIELASEKNACGIEISDVTIPSAFECVLKEGAELVLVTTPYQRYYLSSDCKIVPNVVTMHDGAVLQAAIFFKLLREVY